ncbi:hypothetical protein [Alkalinema sp. FACHB-956]|uniref:hypothetical protein n=1 Tax=Alkalinema sp. FACHB-956 TaxID=2692768 RepID=UPI001687A8F9|nr:hypothetical protein [Alkalinema sp. FACHB-956]MBD2329682.1 hypothetical protein [Alkalinema sp. FACHB-956]
MQNTHTDHFSATAAQTVLEAVPEKIKAALIAYAAEMDYPIEAVIEMAIASFLDEDAVSFTDCRPLVAFGMERKAS